ncbi:FadR/GntR family transcriptional regulator [Mycobacterium sp. MFM001]|uniref:FadR/GntR family transcriptional regulator n=1 Tax=Mycobacterium sp. MFM001 TaxID=2049453 RepID=UPI00352EEF3D
MTGEPQPDKRAAQIARRIEADIIRRGWPVGESLGSEHALQQRYHVSRSVLREAVRLVEHHQVARMRRGPGGGLLVCEPDAAAATNAVVIYLEYQGTTVHDLLGARLLLEPLAAVIAAERIDETGIQRLRDVLQTASQHEFHTALAAESKNPVLQLFIDILMRLTTQFARGSRADAGALDRTRDEHAEIVAAVTAGDSARAQTLSERHVESVTAWLQQHRKSTRPRRPDAAPAKRAEVLAGAIRDDIAAGGWQIGSILGSEVELLERYRVSRSVFREAVRLLEYHAVARMRRGPGGGLVVGKPQAQASIDTIALYLQYREPSRDDLRLVRDVIEIDNVAKVVGRHDAPEVRAFLDTHRQVIDDTGDDLRKAGMEEFLFHSGMAKLAGNAVLDLFLRILVELFRRQWAAAEQKPPSHGDFADVQHAHRRIIEAIADGDDSLARHRARRHLDAAASWWL